MTSVIFGATSSPSTAIFVKNKNAEEYRDQYPEGAKAIILNHYMNDYLQSFDTIQEARKVAGEVAYIHQQAQLSCKDGQPTRQPPLVIFLATRTTVAV